MAHSVRGVRGDGIGWGRPTTNQVLLDEVRHIRTRLDALETTRRRDIDIGDFDEAEQTSKEEVEEETLEEKMINMIAWIIIKPRLDVPMYEGSLNPEELIDCISAMDEYFDYEKFSWREES